MLRVPPPTRVALGTLEIGGKKVELFLSQEWALYFQSLNTQVQSNGTVPAGIGMHAGILDQSMEAPDVFPGPPGPRGNQGDAGLALFLLQDCSSDEPLLVAPTAGNNAPAAGRFTTLEASAGFGCNGKAAQAPAPSGGTLAGVIAALVANGILSN